MICKFKDLLQLFSAVDEWCVPAFVGPDEIRDLVDDLDTMYN